MKTDSYIKQQGGTMLILVRRRGESLKIGDNIELQIHSVVGNKVKLGITAPPEIPVHREEIHQKHPAKSTEVKQTLLNVD